MNRLLVGVVALVLVVIPMSPVGSQETGPDLDLVSWLSTGDSYSSGEGVFGNEGDCAQSEDAWGRVAAEELTRSGWTIPLVGFTACTGHLVEDFYNPRGGSKDSLYDWGLEQGVPERVDVLTLSFGGNDIGFADVIRDCLVLPDSWVDLGELGTWFSGCDISELELQERINAFLEPSAQGCLGGRATNVVDPDPFSCALLIGPNGERGSFVDFLVKLAEGHLTSRGRLVVGGYPQLFAPTGEWPGWSFAGCAGVPRGDTEKLGRVAAYFDAKLRTAAFLANQRLGADRVVYVSTWELYRDGSHELCGTGDDWINGVTTTRGEGQTFRWLGSFHPNWAGHENTGQAVAEELQKSLVRGSWESIEDVSETHELRIFYPRLGFDVIDNAIQAEAAALSGEFLGTFNSLTEDEESCLGYSSFADVLYMPTLITEDYVALTVLSFSSYCGGTGNESLTPIVLTLGATRIDLLQWLSEDVQNAIYVGAVRSLVESWEGNINRLHQAPELRLGLTADGLTVHFGKGELGFGADGAQAVLIPYETLDDGDFLHSPLASLAGGDIAQSELLALPPEWPYDVEYPRYSGRPFRQLDPSVGPIACVDSIAYQIVRAAEGEVLGPEEAAQLAMCSFVVASVEPRNVFIGWAGVVDSVGSDLSRDARTYASSGWDWSSIDCSGPTFGPSEGFASGLTKCVVSLGTSEIMWLAFDTGPEYVGAIPLD